MGLSEISPFRSATVEMTETDSAKSAACFSKHQIMKEKICEISVISERLTDKNRVNPV